jgi:hypothetical protein
MFIARPRQMTTDLAGVRYRTPPSIGRVDFRSVTRLREVEAWLPAYSPTTITQVSVISADPGPSGQEY